jgi:AcrR family transcriptional regulator
MARVTTRRIAETAGVSEGTIFKYFKSKNDLLLSALQRRGIPGLEILAPDATSVATVHDNLAKAGRLVLRYYADVIPSLVAALADIDLLPDHRKWFQQHPCGYNGLAEAVGAYVVREQQLGRIRADIEPTFVAEILLGSCLRQIFGRIFCCDLSPCHSDEDFADGLADRMTSAIAI